MNIGEIERFAREVFSNRREVVASYLYGSFLKGTRYRDVDIGIVVDENFKPGVFYEVRIAKEFEQKFQGSGDNRVSFDVRILNKRPLRFLFNVLKESKLIYVGDESKRIEFESRVMKEYLDFKPHYELYDKMRRLRHVK
ncbi:MAG: nucleotidyltransferase domain-containing protein [Archaeoglobus sp.]|nr:nucleotidyltransferase domain-containing protein [Archaeoglobus sp.]